MVICSISKKFTVFNRNFGFDFFLLFFDLQKKKIYYPNFTVYEVQLSKNTTQSKNNSIHNIQKKKKNQYK